MIDTIITIIKIILVIGIVYIIFNYINTNDKTNEFNENFKCELDKIDIDDMVIINRNPEYVKLIDKLIDDKKFIFTDEELKTLKNPNQFYQVKDGQVKNISDQFYNKCDPYLDTVVNRDTEYFNNLSDNEKLSLQSSTLYNNIIGELKKDVENTLPPDCLNTAVLTNPKYLKNYYMDIFGNKVKADLSDYFANYYTTINEDQSKEAIPVQTLIGKPNFIIPEQYNIEKYFTNAYNVDWSRIVNPLTIY